MAAGTLFLLACCARTPARPGRKSVIAGLALILAAVALQQMGVALSALIDHNTLFHALVFVGLAVCFHGLDRLSGSPDAAPTR